MTCTARRLVFVRMSQTSRPFGNRQKLRNHSPLSWLRRRVCAFLHLSRPSGLVVYAHCHRELVTKSWTATMTTDRWTCSSLERQEAIEEASRRARGDRQGCTECRRFPLRAYTGVHHDRCRLEVAAAQRRCPLSSCLWVACSSSGSQVARRLPGRHSSVAASRCAAGLDFLFGAVPRGDRHLGALKMVFCPKAHAGHW